jgi:lauroyl/myristoyl acyltransferase
MVAYEHLDKKWSLQESLARLTHDPVGLSALSRLDEKSLLDLAEVWYGDDLYLCGTIARNGLATIFGHNPTDEQAIKATEHILWCSWRNALWNTGRLRPDPALRFENQHHADDTAGVPTIVISPMMLCTQDILALILKCYDKRPIVLYGEGIATKQYSHLKTPEHVQVIGDSSLHSISVILRTLMDGGVFCTYPDFVYEGHSVLDGYLFGCSRPYSKAFISLCARQNVHLLPVLARREGDGLVASFEEPVVFEFDSRPDVKKLVERTVLYAVQSLLEDLINQKPEQWLLLGTLSAEACRTVD